MVISGIIFLVTRIFFLSEDIDIIPGSEAGQSGGPPTYGDVTDAPTRAAASPSLLQKQRSSGREEKEHKNPLLSFKRLHRKESDSKSKRDSHASGHASPKSPRALPVASTSGFSVADSDVTLCDVSSDPRDVKGAKRLSTASEAKSEEAAMHAVSNGRVVRPEEVELQLLSKSEGNAASVTPASTNGVVALSDDASFVTVSSAMRVKSEGESSHETDSEQDVYTTPM